MAKQKGSKKGKGTLEQQVAKLRSELKQDQQDWAASLAKDSPAVVRLAFKLLERTNRKVDGLTKKEQKTYDTLLALPGVSNAKEVADKYKAQIVAARKAAAEAE